MFLENTAILLHQLEVFRFRLSAQEKARETQMRRDERLARQLMEVRHINKSNVILGILLGLFLRLVIANVHLKFCTRSAS